MREPEEVDCEHAHECFGGGYWGKGAFDDPLSSAAGGRPWMECHCMTAEERNELKMGMATSGSCSECGETIDFTGKEKHDCVPKCPICARPASTFPCTHGASLHGKCLNCGAWRPKCKCQKSYIMEQGAKFDTQKPDWSLIPSDAILGIIRVYEHGVRKYGRDNWRKGILYSRIFAAIMRHLWDWWKGADENAEDENLKHLAQAAWGCLTLLEYTKSSRYQTFDDRLVEESWPAGFVDYDPTSSPATVSIPSVWTPPQDDVAYTLTTTISGKEGTMYVLKNGQLEECPAPEGLK